MYVDLFDSKVSIRMLTFLSKGSTRPKRLEAGLVWFWLVWSGLLWSGLVWSGLLWSRLVWSGLVWFRDINVYFVQDILCLFDLSDRF